MYFVHIILFYNFIYIHINEINYLFMYHSIYLSIYLSISEIYWLDKQYKLSLLLSL